LLSSCLAQEGESKKFPAFNAETGKDLGTYPPNPVVDFIHMKLVLDIPDMNTPRASVEQTLTVAALSKPVGSLTLNAHLLEIADVKCEGHAAKFTTDGGTITIAFDPPLEKGVKTDIVTRYAINDPPYGLFWTPESPAWPGRSAQIHSQGQAETNSYWFPCHDFPNERLTTELIVTVPAGYIVSSNGREAEPVKHTGIATRSTGCRTSRT
jgi:aminopeptidase N